VEVEAEVVSIPKPNIKISGSASERKLRDKTSWFSLFSRQGVLVALALLYAVGAIPSAYYIVDHTQASTKAIEHILMTYSMKNEGSLAIDRYADQHPFLGMLFASPIKHELELPSHDESASALSAGIRADLKEVRHESYIAAWWSCFFINFSLLYVITVIAVEGVFASRGALFALATISWALFAIGVIAPAMVIWTAPSIPMATGNLEFVLQHQVRGIAMIIWDLLTNGHWVIGGFLLLFSIITPLTKVSLTYFATASNSKELNFKIGQLLHTIGKWSMADVFVAAILLALYALKYQEATKSIPCLGLYYFIGYCMVSMTTTELLVQSGLVAGNDPKKLERKIGPRSIALMFALLLGFGGLSSAYTYQQYTLNTKQNITPSATPQKLNNADLVLPAHK
jgi:hypothetical protein